MRVWNVTALAQAFADGWTLPSADDPANEDKPPPLEETTIVDGAGSADDIKALTTLDGIGKGYVVDGGVAELKRRGFPDVLVANIGSLNSYYLWSTFFVVP